jgi:hypothetical protein
MTGQYTFVAPERQNELTRRIQQKLSEAEQKLQKNKVTIDVSPASPSRLEAAVDLVRVQPATSRGQ